MAKRRLIAANWKMHKTWEDAAGFAVNFKPLVSQFLKTVDVVVCPSFISLAEVCRIFKRTKIKVGAQNMYFEKEGAFTAEVSAEMIKSTGAEYVILGHSERRQIFNESDELINKKMKKAIALGLIPILCIGETLGEKEAGKTFEFLESQLKECLDDVKPKFVIAYEPVWAIGTGKNATPEQVQEVHRFIRDKLKILFNSNVADSIRILYGGSVKQSNAKNILDQIDVDGALVGGASLEPSTFAEIIGIATL